MTLFTPDFAAKLYFDITWLGTNGRLGQRFDVPGIGRRDVDVFLPNSAAFEVKASRYVYLGSRERIEIRKDTFLRNDLGLVVEWHIYPNIFGRVRVSRNLERALERAGIPLVVHHFKTRFV